LQDWTRRIGTERHLLGVEVRIQGMHNSQVTTKGRVSEVLLFKWWDLNTILIPTWQSPLNLLNIQVEFKFEFNTGPLRHEP